MTSQGLDYISQYNNNELPYDKLASIFLIFFVAAPLTIFISMVIYVGAIGNNTEYHMIASSSLCLVYFLFSYADLPSELRNSNIIIPCCIMSFLVFLMCFLILILNVYQKEVLTLVSSDVDKHYHDCINSEPALEVSSTSACNNNPPMAI